MKENQALLKHTQIKGLDPAKPYFDLVSEEMRLLPTDAEFVDVIHTNSGEIWNGALSLPEPVGQVDFYPNGGSHQAGCTEVCIGTSCIGIDLVDLFGEYYLLTNSLFNHRHCHCLAHRIQPEIPKV